MRHRVHTFKVGRTGAHRAAMLANMVCSLIEHGQITTSLVKAREARRVAEKMVTLGKKGDLVGYVGKIHPLLLNDMKINQDIFVFENLENENKFVKVF